MKANLILLPAVLLIFTGCFLENEPSEPNLPVYEKEIVWTLETGYYHTFEKPWQDGKYLYCVESNSTYCNTDISFCISKIDLETGQYVWKTRPIDSQEHTTLVKSGDKLYIHDIYYTLYCFSDNDGTLLATVLHGTTTDKRRKYAPALKGSIISYKNYLYWDSVYKNDDNEVIYRGINRFDTEKIDFSLGSSETQIIEPDVFWDISEKQYRLLICPISYNGYIYVQTAAEPETGLKSTFFALDAETGEEKWRYASDCMEGRGQHALYVINDKLYTFELDIACYDIHTGRPLFENYFDLKDCKKKIYAGAIDINDCVTYHEGKFYYTTASNIGGNLVGTPKELIKNIFCIDAKSGEILWSDHPLYDCSLFTKPIVVNGKVFFLCHDELRVYEADTGKLLGSDLSVSISAVSPSASYNGNFIFFNIDRKNFKTILTAIKA